MITISKIIALVGNTKEICYFSWSIVTIYFLHFLFTVSFYIGSIVTPI